MNEYQVKRIKRRVKRLEEVRRWEDAPMRNLEAERERARQGKKLVSR